MSNESKSVFPQHQITLCTRCANVQEMPYAHSRSSWKVEHMRSGNARQKAGNKRTYTTQIKIVFNIYLRVLYNNIII